MSKIKDLKGAKKVFAIFGIILGAIIVFLLLALLCIHLFTPVVFNGFFSNADVEYPIPGLSDGLVTQGYAYVKESDAYLQCGYMADHVSASRIYVTYGENVESSKYVELYASDNTPYTGHPGGITQYGNFVWISNDGAGDDNCVWVISLADILAAENGGKITLTTKFHPETRSAYCYADGKYLWVGEFRDDDKYPTVASHEFQVSGGTNYALVCAYPLDPSTEYGIEISGDAIIPELALSVTDMVQGFTHTGDGRFILSTSYGLKKSHLLIYNITTNQPDESISISGVDVPVYFLDADNLSRDVEMPPMSEEIFWKDGRVYVLFESACQKYIFGNFTRGRHIYSFVLE